MLIRNDFLFLTIYVNRNYGKHSIDSSFLSAEMKCLAFKDIFDKLLKLEDIKLM